jgi:D-beta-D-heptose 7-phosphate kinase/D-beta-D-heptose 1-phosphate adenosyltransferase
MTPQRLEDIVSRAPAKRLLVIGDLMLDEFVWGKVGRISPEAPVPVVEVTRETVYPGGAANVARNLREFTANVSVIGMIGADRGGEQLRELLREEQIGVGDVVTDAAFNTIVKTRIIARQQQVVRVDREQIRTPIDEQVNSVANAVRAQLDRIDAVIFEDYGKGFLAPALVRRVCDDTRAAGKIVAADPNPNHSIDWSNLTAVKPNRSEAFLAAGERPIDPGDSPEDDAALLHVGETLLAKWSTQLLLITLGEQGMMLFQRGDQPHHIPTKARQVFDVSGAGDTAIALFTLALCCDASPVEAAEIANHASAVVVGKLGTATVTREELRASFDHDGGE